jgi:hypothetical protein
VRAGGPVHQDLPGLPRLPARPSPGPVRDHEPVPGGGPTPRRTLQETGHLQAADAGTADPHPRAQRGTRRGADRLDAVGQVAETAAIEHVPMRMTVFTTAIEQKNAAKPLSWPWFAPWYVKE